MVSSDAPCSSRARVSPNYLQNAPAAFVDKVNIKTGTKTCGFSRARRMPSKRLPPALDDDSRRRSSIVSREGVQELVLRDMKTAR